MNRIFPLFALLICGCSSRLIKKEISRNEDYLQHHAGFYLYDPTSKKTLLDIKGDRYFTPASNTKIFTFYATLKILGDSLPGIRYLERNDSLIFWGTGDPSFLYSKVFQNNSVFDFLKNKPGALCFSESNFNTTLLGPGWSWDDYLYNFSCERTPFPVYGNLISLKKRATDWTTVPSFFNQHYTEAFRQKEKEEIVRDWESNQLTHFGGDKSLREPVEIPFHYSADLVADLLSDTLKREVSGVDFFLPKEAHTLKSIPVDSALRIMMQDSDNFIAEQLLMQCASVVSDTLNVDIAIKYMIKNHLKDLPDAPRWVDGSGLSRLNLFTPRSISKLWEKIYLAVPEERLFKLLATGGKSGTIRNWYKSDPPYIFGKTGSLSNNHNLSGFIKTKKGKTLIFVFMNNNFTNSGSEVRKKMEKVLQLIKEKY